jgi:hypothetical protein
MVIEVPSAPGTPKMKVGVEGLLLVALVETKAVLLKAGGMVIELPPAPGTPETKALVALAEPRK